jgi:DNA polymerase-3 subunit delta'
MALRHHFGQPNIRRQLDLLLEQERLPHAILFYGEPGSGLLPAALSLAADILCTSPEEGKACYQCTSCHRTEKLIHPDLHFLLPLAGAKSLSTDYYEPWREAVSANPWMNVFQWTQYGDFEGKQVDIHKEDIAQTVANFSLAAYEGGSKVMIIWMAQYLAKEGNRLLKLIEEPLPNTYFILLSSQREQILPTIRSRCMQIFLPPIREQEMSGLLNAQYGVDESKANLIARQAVQDMNRAMSLIHESLFDFMDQLTVWFRALLNRRSHDLVSWANMIGTQDKEEQKQFALFAIAYIRKLIWYPNQTGTEQLSPERENMMKYLHEQFSPEIWYEIMQGLQVSYEKISRNANTKLLWLSLSLMIKNELAGNRLQHING